MNVFVHPLITVLQITKRCYGLNSASTLESATVLEEAHFVAFWNNMACMIVGITEAVL